MFQYYKFAASKGCYAKSGEYLHIVKKVTRTPETAYPKLELHEPDHEECPCDCHNMKVDKCKCKYTEPYEAIEYFEFENEQDLSDSE